MFKFFNIKKIHIITNIVIFAIFSYIYFFSTKNIINLWTFSEIHINYSAGFIRRGLLGEILRVINNYSYFDKIFFSLIFFIFSILNTYFILKIIKNITNSRLIYIYLSFNPSLILFSFYDLGGYARFEIFGIFLILFHTYICQKTYQNDYPFTKYKNYLIFLIYPFFFITVLIHELNFFFLIIHFYLAISVIISFHRINLKNIFGLIFAMSAIVPLLYIILINDINDDKINIILNSLKYAENVEIWILKSISQSFSNRINSEFAYMARPWTNIIYYFFIFLFFLIPIFLVLKKLSINIKNDTIFLLLSIAPFFLLFFIGRDWGRWMHIIIICLFCFFSQNKNGKLIKIFNKKIIFVLLALIQLSITRIPHCCNIVEKNIHIYGGLIPKIKIFYEMQFNKFDIKNRFKSF